MSSEQPTHPDFQKFSDLPVHDPAKNHLLGGLDFGQALDAMKRGHRVARAGWDGRGMFVYLVPGSTVDFEKLRGPAREAAVKATEIEGGTQGSARYVNAHVDMKDAHGQLVIGWLASQTDMLAEDWFVVP
jgi:hypothetical protein